MIQRSTLAEPYWFSPKRDPAIDSPATDASDETKEKFKAAWAEYRRGLADAPLKPGETATEFQMRHLNTKDIVVLTDLNGGSLAGSIDGQTLWAAARMAVVTARNCDFEDLPKQQYHDGTTMVCPESLLLQIDSPAIVYELGTEAITRRFLDPLSGPA